jgi:hypothetical protein
VPEEQVLVL